MVSLRRYGCAAREENRPTEASRFCPCPGGQADFPDRPQVLDPHQMRVIGLDLSGVFLYLITVARLQ
jgi:hypothetical protein